MPKQKRKNGDFLQGQTRNFIFLWGVAYLLAFAISYFVTQRAEAVAVGIPMNRITLLFLFLLMSLPAVLQVQLIERVFKRSMQGWMKYHLVAASLTTIALLTNAGTWWILDHLLFNMPVYLVMSTLAQTLWFWGRMRFAWLWLPISLFVGLAPGFAFQTSPTTGILTVFFLLFHSLVQGRLMYFLLRHPKETEKAKNDFDTEIEDDARLQRLQEGNESSDLEDDSAIRAARRQA